MICRAGVLAVIAVLACLSVCSALQCTGGVHKEVTNRCELYCGEKDKCVCAKDTNPPSNIDRCLQKCQPSGIPSNPNITVSKCLDMECTGLKYCFQVCTNQECRMQCKSTETCIQECNGGNCTKLVCSGPKCQQQCKGCTMECTKDVKECNQQCYGGTCRAVCSAEKCTANCVVTGNEKCTIISSGEVKCTGDALSKPWIANNDTCGLKCGPKEKCYCDDTSASKSFKDCNQHCRPEKMPNNETIKECPKIECKGFDKCYQGCSRTNTCPDVYCNSRKTCTQECDGKCTKLVCSSPECEQVCSSCTMECTSEVKKCRQSCNGGHCKSICNNSTTDCNCKTPGIPGAMCQVVNNEVPTTRGTIGSHADKASAFSFFNLIALVLLVKNIALLIS